MNKYYNGDELLSRHYPMYFVCGDRFGGKSTWIQKHVLKKAINSIKDGKCTEQFAVLVRYDKDINILCETYFENTINMFYPNVFFKYDKRKFWMYVMDGNKGTTKVLVGHAFALNMATKMKSTSYPFITTMIMEEFMNIEGKYIKSEQNPELEVEMLISLYSTIARGNGHQVRDNCKVVGISNNFYINNPYFRYFKLIDRIIKNPFHRFYECKTEPRCIVEMTHNDVHLDIGRDDLNKGSKFVELKNEIKFINNPKVNKVVIQLSLDSNHFINVAEYNDTAIIFDSGNKLRKDAEACFSCSDIQKANIIHFKNFKGTEYYKTMKEAMLSNSLYYDKLETYIEFYDIMNY